MSEERDTKFRNLCSWRFRPDCGDPLLHLGWIGRCCRCSHQAIRADLLSWWWAPIYCWESEAVERGPGMLRGWLCGEGFTPSWGYAKLDAVGRWCPGFGCEKGGRAGMYCLIFCSCFYFLSTLPRLHTCIVLQTYQSIPELEKSLVWRFQMVVVGWCFFILVGRCRLNV